MRLYVYERKSLEEGVSDSWKSLLLVEQDFLVGSQKEWTDLLKMWNLQDKKERQELEYLLLQGVKEARLEVIQFLEGKVPEVATLLDEFVASGRCSPLGSN